MRANQQRHTPNSPKPIRRAPRPRVVVDLSDTRSESLGEWFYNHRIGLAVVMVAYVIGIIALFTARVEVELKPVEYIVEFVEEVPSAEEVERLKRQRDQLQREIEQRLARAQRVQNLQSNDAAEQAASAEDMSYDAETQQMMDRIASDMATNRGDYESGMREIAGMGKGGTGSGSGGKKGSGEKGKFSGAVTVNYAFENPVRHHRDLYVPAYRTKSGGVVVVDVWLDRNGTVTTARIASSTNPELNQQALAAAKHSRTLFRIDNTAPTSHRGTITYTFVAQ